MPSPHSNTFLQQKYIWTSGRLCDFKGCDRPDLQPVSINGWFWTAELQKLAATTDRRQNDWSENGGIGVPQPDNRELQQGGANENCLAILNNFYNDGIHWVSQFIQLGQQFLIRIFAFRPRTIFNICSMTLVSKEETFF